MKQTTLFLFFAVFFLLVAGCATGRVPTSPSSDLDKPQLISPPNKSRNYQDSRILASHSLTIKGHELLQSGDPEGAIRLLERAVGINPSDGLGYYFLAEAWFLKGNAVLAARFNKLAALYLRGDPRWAAHAESQRKRIAGL